MKGNEIVWNDVQVGNEVDIVGVRKSYFVWKCKFIIMLNLCWKV